MEQDNKPFVWTDELVKEFFHSNWYQQYLSNSSKGLEYYMGYFKESKELLQVPVEEKVEVTQITQWNMTDVLNGGRYLKVNISDYTPFIGDKFPALKEAMEKILNSETNHSNTYTEPVGTFEWQLALSGITGKVLGLRNVLLDVEITKGLKKEMSKDLSNIAELITKVLSSIKTSTLK